MVARANAGTWISIVKGKGSCLLATAVLCAFSLVLIPGKAKGQTGARSSKAQIALNSAIEASERGDYEKASALFQQAQVGVNDLSPQAQKDLERWIQFNTSALKARRDGAEQVQLAEQAVSDKRPQEAADLLKKALANKQYLRPVDKQKADELFAQVSVRPSGPTTAGNSNSQVAARTKLQQARALLAQSNFDAAEKLAREAEGLGATFSANDDTPRKVLEDINKARGDPKALLSAARSALRRNDLDRAEQLARAADKASQPWTFTLSSDSPSKVLKEVQAARAPKVGQQPQDRMAAKPADTPAEKQGSMLDPIKNLLPFGKGKDEERPKTNTPDNSPARAQNTEKARQLLQQARQALANGNLDQAKTLTDQAGSLNPALEWWETDTPAKLQAEIQRAQAQARGPSADGKDNKLTTDDPRALVKQGREFFKAGKLDEAAEAAARAKSNRAVNWGYFDDTPDSLLRDIDKARRKRDQEESWHILAEGRRLFEQGDYENASKKAYLAQKLHGPYSILDLGDQPGKLLAEIDTAKAKNRKVQVPQVPGSGGAQRTADQARVNDELRVQKARQMLAEARVVSRNGDHVRALLLVDEVQAMGVTLDKPGDLNPADVRREITQAMAQANPKPGGAQPVNPDPRQPNLADASTPKRQAQQLLTEARQLGTAGRLVEARQKAEQARLIGANFGPDEDDPVRALLDIGSQCRKRIDALTQEATDLAAGGASDPSRYQKAEANLLQAQQLASSFGFGTQQIDSKLDWVRQLRTRSLAGVGSDPGLPPKGVVQIQDKQLKPDDPQFRGRVLLDQARMELRNGQLVNARNLAKDVYNGNYGLRSQAEAFLRELDVEEHNQQRLAAGRTFDAGHSAFKRQDYTQAAVLFRALDPHLLDAEKRTKLKELMLTPQMQQTNLAQGQKPVDPRVQQVVDTTPGHAQIKDDKRDNDLMTQAQALQEVKFQQLRHAGLEAQREAMDLFKAGDTDRALEVLQDYVANLGQAGFDAERVALLRRPVEARYQQLKTLKVQRDLAKEQITRTTSVAQSRDKRNLAEKHKQEKVAELMQQYNTFYKDGKYKEAEMYAQLALELDPDNTPASAALQIARVQRKQLEYKNIKDRKENMVRRGLNDGDDEGYFVGSIDNPVHINRDVMEWNLKNRGKWGEKGIDLIKPSDKQREIEHKLQTPVTLKFKDTPLRQVLDDIRAWQSINIDVDLPALQENVISLDRPITVQLNDVSLKNALELMLHQVHLTYVIKNEVLYITTVENAKGRQVPKVYQVADLVLPVEDHGVAPSSTLQSLLDRISNGPGRGIPSGGASPYVGPSSLPDAQGVGTPSGSYSTGSYSISPRSGTTTTTHNATNTIEGLLIRLIKNTIAPQSWDDAGGSGTIDYFPLGMALVINQTGDIQEQIAELLAALRRLQDQEVAVEVRFITIAEGFFERIGLDFNINIKTDRETARFEPQLVTQQFKPVGFVNDFNPDRFIAGLTPAGTFTSDLDIPIRSSSFAQAIPPFGGFPNIPGGNGGLALGLAFLSDIQVFLFMEAAQGDQRTNVMQAPKLTMFNGQTATISIQDFQFFVTNVQLIQVGGQFAFVPQVQPMPNGVSLTVQAVISADRRYVRMTLIPQITNLASAVVPLFPITAAVNPVFEGGFVGAPVIFTQFIQQPVLSTINVMSTVSVPDGGTVLLGGLKRLSEGRNEFGPPIFSKIPYINRLFKNVGYGRETTSLMLMVTPRIIINEEEEFRATGVGTPIPLPQ